MSKVLQIAQNGFVWQVDAHVIADDRAKYYAKADKDTTYDAEYHFTLDDHEELEDWFKNNMNWGDVPFANRRLIQSPSVPEDGPDFSEDNECEVIEAA